jgi:hypothetical protein
MHNNNNNNNNNAVYVGSAHTQKPKFSTTQNCKIDDIRYLESAEPVTGPVSEAKVSPDQSLREDNVSPD